MSKRRDLRILFNTNVPWANSGYSVEARDLMRRWVKDEWKVAMSGFAGLGGGVIDYEGYKIYPTLQDMWGSDAIVSHGRHHQANIVMSFQDVWPLQPQALQQITAEGRKFIPYVPIDQEPVPEGVLNVLRFAYKIVTFSKFGQKALEKAGFTSKMIYEGTDTEIFKPMSKIEARKELGLPQDKFIFGMIGANKENPSRKSWQQNIEAFKMFHDKHPDSIFFYESNQNNQGAGGFPILQFANHLGISKDVFHIDEYQSVVHAGSEVMNKMLNAFDVTLHASSTEGFGLVIIESQSAGTPIIVNRSQSQPELVIEGKTGLICETGHKLYSSSGGYWQIPSTISLYDKMEEAFKADRKKMGEEARQWVLDNFDINKIVQNEWLPYFEKLQDELLPVDTKDKK